MNQTKRKFLSKSVYSAALPLMFLAGIVGVLPSAANAATVTISTDGTGDYNTDSVADEVEFQTAIDYVNANGGGTVLVKAGTYWFNAYVSLKNNVNMEGEGANTIIAHRDPNLDPTVNTTGFPYRTGHFDIRGKNNVTIQNLKIFGNRTHENEVACNYNAECIKHGVFEHDAWNAEGISIYDGSSNITIKNVILDEVQGDPIDSGGSWNTNITIQDNEFIIYR